MTLAAAWTGGQYSAVRAIACLLLAVAALEAAFQSSGLWIYHATIVVGLLAFATGFGGRPLAAYLALVIPFSDGTLHASVAFVASTWLSLHVLLPAGAFGSYEALGRTRPGGSWVMPSWYPLAWQAMFVITRLLAAADAAAAGSVWSEAIYILAAALVLAPRWGMTGWGISILASSFDALGGDGSILAVLVIHLLTFQPAWLPRRDPDGDAILFYDGSCALCHGVVRFLLAEDPAPPRYRLAPLGGPAFLERVPAARRASLPDSVVVMRGDEILTRSAAVSDLLDTLGGVWRVVAAIAAIFPEKLLDSAYDAVAARRYAWFGRKPDACPLLPPDLRTRIEA